MRLRPHIRRKIKKRKLFELQKGLCYWCNEPMIYPDDGPKRGGKQPPKLCTLEHLNDRFSPIRETNLDIGNTVVACYECNHKRGINSYMENRDDHLHSNRRHPDAHQRRG